jgi:hypothetical protein
MKTTLFGLHTEKGKSVEVRTWEQHLGTVAA